MNLDKPGLPDSPLPALMDHEGHFQQLYPESMVRQYGDDMIAFERKRILALLDTFGDQCQAQGMAMSESGHADAKIVNAQLDAVRLLMESINAG